MLIPSLELKAKIKVKNSTNVPQHYSCRLLDKYVLRLGTCGMDF